MSIHKDGPTYFVAWREPADANGVQRQHKKRGFTTKKAATEFLANVTASLANHTYIAGSDRTFGEYLNGVWLPGLTVRDSTKRSYAGHVRLYLIPHLGHIPLQQVTAGHLRKMYRALRISGARGALSASTVRRIHATAHSALSAALNDGLIGRNPATGLKLEAVPRPERAFWNAEQVRAFVTAIADDRLASLYTFMAVTGLRRGEAVGLRWRDVELEAGGGATVHVHQQLVDIGYTLAFTQPKTKQSSRAVIIDPRTAALLRTHQRSQNAKKALWGPAYQDQDLVFAREDGTPVHPDFVSKHFQYLVESRHLPRIRLHDLRHSHASILFGLGHQPKVISDRLGHSSVAFTLDTYTHLLPAQREDAAAAVSDLVLGHQAISE